MYEDSDLTVLVVVMHWFRSIFVLKLVLLFLLTAIACFHLALIGSMDISWCALIGMSHKQATYGQPWNKAHYKYELVRFWKVSLPHQQLPGVQLPLVKGWGCITVSELSSVKQTLTLIRLGGVSMVTFACNLMNLVIWSAVPSHGHMANQLLVSSPDHSRGGVGMRPTKCKPPCPIRFSKCKLLDLAGTSLPPNCKTLC